MVSSPTKNRTRSESAPRRSDSRGRDSRSSSTDSVGHHDSRHENRKPEYRKGMGVDPWTVFTGSRHYKSSDGSSSSSVGTGSEDEQVLRLRKRKKRKRERRARRKQMRRDRGHRRKRNWLNVAKSHASKVARAFLNFCCCSCLAESLPLILNSDSEERKISTELGLSVRNIS